MDILILAIAIVLFVVWLAVTFWPVRRSSRAQYSRYWSGQKMGVVQSRIEYE